MTVHRILTHPNTLLTQVADPVTSFDEDLIHLTQDMLSTMFNHGGRGLAAVQIGIMKRVVVFHANEQFYVMTNPVITRTGRELRTEIEGCLSIPKRQVEVTRPALCEVDYQDLHGVHHCASLRGEAARVAQHEIDHLNGVLIINKVTVKESVYG